MLETKRRIKCGISEQLNTRFNDYLSAAASSCNRGKLAQFASLAGAAGVGLLASTVPAHASIIYTPENGLFAGRYGDYPMFDLKLPGVGNTLRFSGQVFGYPHSNFVYYGANRNAKNIGSGLVNVLAASNGYAAALPYRAAIGPTGNFIPPGLLNHHSTSFSSSAGVILHSKSTYRGNFRRGNSQFLGIQFSSNGAKHYGWIEIGIDVDSIQDAAVEGFAYETNPNQGIAAGQKVDTVPEPATVGLLALGATGLGFWRRRKTAA